MTAEVILLTLLMFFVLVSFHEWGHYYFAKRAGILVREFAIGFGPKLFSYKRSETRFTFRLFPLGGYVRMAGEDPEIIEVSEGQTIAVQLTDDRVTHIFLDQLDTRKNALRGVVESIDLEHQLKLKLDVDGDLQNYTIDPNAFMITRGRETQIAPWNRQYGSKTVGQRAMAIFAGPMMNFVLALLLFFVFIYMTGVPVDNPQHIELSSISEQSPASNAGLQKKDIVDQVNGTKIGADRDALIEMIKESPGKEMDWVIQRDGELHELKVTPRNENGNGLIGVGITFPHRTPTFIEAVSHTGTTMYNAGKQITISLQKLITLQFKIDDFGGPIRITEFTGEAVSQGMNMYIFWAGLLSLYLGMFNLLPFPAMDGSRLLFLGLEGIRGKPIDPHREGMVHFIGFAMLMLLMIAVTYNDILRLFKG